jgi:arsenate reductase-like glutaredoxin family protein
MKLSITLFKQKVNIYHYHNCNKFAKVTTYFYKQKSQNYSSEVIQFNTFPFS